jgi:hypothetical protein
LKQPQYGVEEILVNIALVIYMSQYQPIDPAVEIEGKAFWMARYKLIYRGMKRLPFDLSVQLFFGTTSSRGSSQKDALYKARPTPWGRACPTNGSDRGFASLARSNLIR